MKNSNYIVPLTTTLSKESIGNKAASLQFMKRHKLKIPLSYVVLQEAFLNYLENEPEVINKIKTELKQLPDYSYAVRSSTSFEDADDFSHAGQFETFLNVKGTGQLLNAIIKVWKSAMPKEHDMYLEKSGKKHSVTCAVIIQKMVDSRLAGVSFSKNPVNNLHETIIEAVEGSGEKLVQKGETPLRWIYKKNKLTNGNSNYKEIGLIHKVAKTTLLLKTKFRTDVDLEWAYDGKQLYLLQIRSITANAKLSIYSNKMAKEMLPGQIKPLVWSLNIPLVNGSWIEILEKVIGKCELQPEDLAKSFYYRTYFNVSNLAGIFAEFGVPFESIEEMMLDENKIKHTFKPGIKTLKHSFRLVKFISWILKFESHFLKEFPLLEKDTKDLNFKIESTNAIGEQFNILYNDLFKNAQALTRLNIITPLLMRAYSKRLGKKLNKLGVKIEEIDFNIDFPELKMLSPVVQISEIREQINKLPADIREKTNTYKEFSQWPETQTIVKLLQEFIEKFGHHSESGNDISYKKWEEDHEFVFKMVIDFIDIKNKPQQIHFQKFKIPFFKKRKYKKTYQKAGRFALYREQISSLFIFGYGLFRKLYLKVADDFVKRELLNHREDIFYLDKKEVQEIIDGKMVNKTEWKKIVASREEEYKRTKDLILPAVIYGEEAPLIEQGSIKNFTGVGTSSGTFKGRTKVVNHTADFNKVTEGDVVIIPFSDVSWTPTLIKAGAIVSESGGMLSHCSIIAREMGIPALVSVDNACSLDDNLLVTVNGSNGVLTIHD